VVHGANDTTFRRARGISKGVAPEGSLEALIHTGTRSRCFLYYSANSGELPNGGRTRHGDAHDRATTLAQFRSAYSLLQYDCLPRLVDAVTATEACPEVAFVRSWQRFLSPERLAAEAKLGYNPEQLRQSFWQSAGRRGQDTTSLFLVEPGTDEHGWVSTIFLAEPMVPPHYRRRASADWPARTILKIERVENGAQHGATDAHHKNLRASLHDQGIAFEGGVHVKWLFHGTTSEAAIASIVKDPMSGFKMSMAGSTAGTLWGAGTYCARDPHYCFDHGFYARGGDGSCKLFLCLVETGMPTVGDPELSLDMLPFRQQHHRYTSVVDSLSNPEVFCVGHAPALFPAYLITFA